MVATTEQFTNYGQTTLNGSVDGSTDPIDVVVVDGTQAPPQAPFRLTITDPSGLNGEILICTNDPVGNTLRACVRAQENTAKVAHAIGSVVYIAPTAKQMQEVHDHLDADASPAGHTAGKLHINVNEQPPTIFARADGSSANDGRWDRPKDTIANAIVVLPSVDNMRAGEIIYAGPHVITDSLLLQRFSGSLKHLGWGRTDGSDRGSVIIWAGGNDRPVICLRASRGAEIYGRVTNAYPNDPAHKAPCVLSLANDSTGNSYDPANGAYLGPGRGPMGGDINGTSHCIIDLFVGDWEYDPAPPYTHGVNYFGDAILFEGADQNNDGNRIKRLWVRYCDRAVNQNGHTQHVNTFIEHLRTIGCITPLYLTSNTRVVGAQLLISTQEDIYIDQGAKVVVEGPFTGELSKRMLTMISGMFKITDGYWEATTNIDSNGYMIFDTAGHQNVIILDEFELTLQAGYTIPANPLPVARIRAGSGFTKIVNHRGLRLPNAVPVTQFFDVTPASDPAGVVLLNGTVFDQASVKAHDLKNRIKATTDTVDPLRIDFTDTMHLPTYRSILVNEFSDNGAGTDQVVQSLSIPANQLPIGSVIEFVAYGTLENTTGGPAAPTVNIKLKRGTVVAATAPTISIPPNTLGRAFHLRGTITVRTIGAGGTCIGAFFYSDAGGNVRAVPTATIALDTTIANTFSFSENWTVADAHLTMRVEQCVIQIPI